MPSFISNFKSSLREQGPSWRALGAFGYVFLICTVVGLFVGSALSPQKAWRGIIPAFPPGEDYIVQENYNPEVFDYYAFYYGIGPSMKNAGKADVLILGNSKPFFAFHAPSLRDFEQRTGLRIFNMALPSGDGYPLAKAIFDRQQLCPSIIVINEDHFFTDTPTPYGAETISKGYWGALTSTFEHRLAWPFRMAIARLFPRFNLGKMTNSSIPEVQYRSTKDGCLVMKDIPTESLPVPAHSTLEESLSPQELATALRFKEEMAARGITVILTSVPYGADQTLALEKWIKDPEKREVIKHLKPYEKVDGTAKALGLPFIGIPGAGLETFDGNHLTDKSAVRFTDAFFSRFAELPCVQTLIRERKKSAP